MILKAPQVPDPKQAWTFWIDRGGTFTDVVARRADGRCETRKLLSQNPSQYADAAVAGIRQILATQGETLGSAHIELVRMGTTVATNALLERRGEPTLLAITAGHGDALRIGYQSRPRLFDRNIQIPAPLYQQVIEIEERMGADGETFAPLDESASRQLLQQTYNQGLRALAIVLIHAYRYPAHETRLAEIAREIGFEQISVSHEVSALIKLVGRGETTVADAYLSPLLRRYVEGLRKELGEVPLQFMQSSGGLVDADQFRGRDAVLSGPAGGIVGMIRTAQQAGFDRLIGFDMGGTSTDVSHFSGELERTHETQIAGVRLRTPMMDIHTVAAGGGSECWYDGLRLRVGPQSASARPGPACYRNGGPLTITDCNAVLGKVQPDTFPAVFGPDANQPIDPHCAVERLQAICDDIFEGSQQRYAPQTLAEGFIRIAVEHMANAIKQISIARGRDVSDYTLVCFGGAAGQHACAVAEALGMHRAILHPYAGVLSAYGMGMARRRVIREQTVDLLLDDQFEAPLQTVLKPLIAQATQQLHDQNVNRENIRTQCMALVKYAGSDTSLPVRINKPNAMRREFQTLHQQRFGFIAQDKPIVVDALSVEAEEVGSAEEPGEFQSFRASKSGIQEEQPESVSCYLNGKASVVTRYRRAHLSEEKRIDGPAIISEETSTTVIEPGWRGHCDALGNLILERSADRIVPAIGTQADPIMREVFNTLFMAVAEQMGETLQSTAHSVNIKERLDFSCAMFDQQGALIANAPHIPVHLGSMGDSVRAVISSRQEKDGRGFHKGDAWMLNAPYNGGTHLPDITVIVPVFDHDDTLFAFLAARGHHADIGGITPGSMPPDSCRVEEEGVLIDDFQLMDQGKFREAETRALLASGDWPARNPDQNIADLQAQLAACARGTSELLKLVDRYGRDVICAYMQHAMDNAEHAVRAVIASLDAGEFSCEMDSGAIICVRITPDKKSKNLRIDFAGTSEQQMNNFNAPIAVCRAAVLYVIRTLVNDDIPLNDGCMRPIELIVPEGCMLKPSYPAAVVAGNVETSQIIVDTLYGALGIMAAAQGSMNNLTFGNEHHQYYETLCGGAGAGADHDGASAVHTHMTNSRLTDVEVLESRYPVRLDQFSLRPGSGGQGDHRGGDGVVRKIQFLAPMQVAILSNRRRVAPHAIGPAQPGACGRNTFLRSDGRESTLDATASLKAESGDSILIETPGGGGYSRADTSRKAG